MREEEGEGTEERWKSEVAGGEEREEKLVDMRAKDISRDQMRGRTATRRKVTAEEGEGVRETWEEEEEDVEKEEEKVLNEETFQVEGKAESRLWDGGK
ncbi:hypothetical protein LSTR_LSTR005756 [Laodelphax striatellus]|uniref:Uncharacterized protein n=1 Tax=Laodelphax striatellus TaxID=195883 RepID=A0A482WQ82_LAOST|nr:hypothetical protein LSTR_LSTR015072 [Laodelphax striatellus]RZF39128.1 hypothetical protein LSTR_LSTR005756 [Laodelphax striatellus]